MIVEILNFPDDLERKVLRFGIFVNHSDFKLHQIKRQGIPTLEECRKYDGFAVRPLEDDTAIDCQTKGSDSGSYNNNSFGFTVKMQDLSDVASIEKYRNKKVIIIIETSLFRYFIGNHEEPLTYTFKENTSRLSISLSGDSRFKTMRQKISPF